MNGGISIIKRDGKLYPGHIKQKETSSITVYITSANFLKSPISHLVFLLILLTSIILCSGNSLPSFP